MPKRSVNSRPYLKTCELIYQLASQRIGEKYRKWEADNPKYNTQSQFFPEDRKLKGIKYLTLMKSDEVIETLKVFSNFFLLFYAWYHKRYC